MQFKGDDEVLSVEFKGATYDVLFPSFEDMTGYQERVKACDGNADGVSAELFKFLEKQGLPISVSQSMSVRKITDLVSTLTNVEKKT